MFAGILLLLAVLLFSFCIVRGFARTVFPSSVESLGVAVPFGIASYSLLVSGFSVVTGKQTLAMWLALAVMAMAGAAALYKSKSKWRKFWLGAVLLPNKWLYGIVTVVLGIFLSTLVVGTLQSNSDGSIQVPKQASVDVAYHLSQVVRIGQTQQWNFEEPNFADEFIRYPYFVNMFSGLMYQAGASLEWAFHAPVVLLIFALVLGSLLLLRGFGLTWTHTVLVVVLTFFGSGLAYVLGYDFNAGPLAVTYPQQHINYTGFVAGFLAVQRAFLLGFALLIFAVLAFWRGLQQDNLRALQWSGILLGLLPLAHTHSFFVGAIIFGLILLYYIIRRDPTAFDIVRGTVFFSTFVAIVPLLAILLLPSYNLGGVPAVRWGWMTNPTEIGGLNLPPQGGSAVVPWLNFLVSNFGGMLLLFVATLSGLVAKWRSWKQEHVTPIQKAFWFAAMSGVVLWLVPNFIQFQTWDYDTNKFFVYAILFSSAACALLIQTWSGWWSKLGTGLLLAILIFALPIPVLKLRHALTSQHKETVTMFTQQQQEASRWLSHNTSENSVLVTSAIIAHPQSLLNSVAMGSGLSTSVGYITWLYTHGIDYEPRLQIIEKSLQSGNFELLNKQIETDNGAVWIPADYLVVDEILQKRYPELENKLNQAKIEQVFHNSGYSIYRL